MSKCTECKRELPNKSFITENGCMWCDLSFYRTKEEEKRLSVIMEILKDGI